MRHFLYKYYSKKWLLVFLENVEGNFFNHTKLDMVCFFKFTVPYIPYGTVVIYKINSQYYRTAVQRKIVLNRAEKNRTLISIRNGTYLST